MTPILRRLSVPICLCLLWAAPLAARALSLRTQRITRHYPAQNFDLDARFPQVANARTPQERQFNRYVRRLVAKRLAAFRREQQQDLREAPPGRTGKNLSLAGSTGFDDVTCEVRAATDAFVSVYFTDESFPAQGAAHPNHASFTVNYDLRAGRALSLADVFGTPSYLKTLSDYCIRVLSRKKDADRDWVRRGAGPTATNYTSWNLTPAGLVINFDPYQVAAYVYGDQRVRIPYAALRPILRPGLLADYQLTHGG